MENKQKHGGRRKNAGRPIGARSKATIQRELAANNAIDQILAKLSEDEIKRFTPLEIMVLAMHALLQSGDLMGAVSVASRAAPFIHARLSSDVPVPPLPDELMPDPAPIPDEPGPGEDPAGD